MTDNKNDGQKTLKTIQKTCSDFGETFTQASDKLADMCIDKSDDGKKNKVSKLSSETVNLVKDLASGSKENLKNISLENIISDASYGIGKISGATKTTGSWIMNKFNKGKKMNESDRVQFQNLGKNFYEWYMADNLKFECKPDNMNIKAEIERLSQLIEYVKNKKIQLTE